MLLDSTRRIGFSQRRELRPRRRRNIVKLRRSSRHRRSRHSIAGAVMERQVDHFAAIDT
jgi:hypothetical protein